VVDDGPSIEARLTAIEERLGMEAGLRAALDRDLSTIAQRQAAANHLIQALSITQSQHTEELATHTQLLRSAHTKLDLLVTMLGQLSDEPEGDQLG
jgi:hypothetical protein